MQKYLSLAMTVCAFIGFNYGLARFFKVRKALYTRMIVFGIGSAMMGRLFETLMLFAFGEIPTGFHIGVLGVMSSFLFFFTATFGQMDSLVDDGSPRFRKYRMIGLLAPAGIAEKLQFAGAGLRFPVYGGNDSEVSAAFSDLDYSR